MNAYNQDKNKADTKSVRYRTDGRDDPFKLLITKYLNDVKTTMISILQKDKKLSAEKADDFCDDIFSLGDKRQKDIATEIQDCYVKGMTLKDCANQLIEKYYKITKNNKYINAPSYQRDRNLGGDGEITEIDESVKDLMKPKSNDELIKSLGDLSIDEILVKGSTMGSDSLVNYALDNGADIHYNNDEAIRMASYQGNTETVQLLINNGADVNVYDGLPLILAKTNNHIETARLLKQHMKVNEKVKYENFKEVSISLFWNFVYRLNDLSLKFNFNTAHVKGLQNSLNTTGYELYMETQKIKNREVEYEFLHSKLLSSILNYILGSKNTEDETSFYVGFDGKTQLHFGFIINEKRFKIGYVPYNSATFQKLIPYIQVNTDIDLNKLSRKFVSNIDSLGSINLILNYYLEKYEDDVEIYSTIINNNFGIIIETIDNENITQQYIENIIKQYVKISRYSNWYVEKMKSNNKTVYYFILK